VDLESVFVYALGAKGKVYEFDNGLELGLAAQYKRYEDRKAKDWRSLETGETARDLGRTRPPLHAVQCFGHVEPERQRLSLGYFISRLAASKAVSSGQVGTTPDALNRLVKSPSVVNTSLSQGGYEEEVDHVVDDALIVAVSNAIALWFGVWPWGTFDMNGLDAFAGNPSAEDIAFTYDTISIGWSSRQDIVDPYEAVWKNLGSLNSPGNLLFEMPERIKDLYPFTPESSFLAIHTKWSFSTTRQRWSPYTPIPGPGSMESP
jgi:hypothetical protein